MPNKIQIKCKKFIILSLLEANIKQPINVLKEEGTQYLVEVSLDLANKIQELEKEIFFNNHLDILENNEKIRIKKDYLKTLFRK